MLSCARPVRMRDLEQSHLRPYAPKGFHDSGIASRADIAFRADHESNGAGGAVLYRRPKLTECDTLRSTDDAGAAQAQRRSALILRICLSDVPQYRGSSI